MLYEAIRYGCEKYHSSPNSFDYFYNQYLEDRDDDKWDNPETLDFSEVNRVIKFANQWGSRIRYDDNVVRIIEELKRQLPKLSLLKKNTLLDVKFDESTCELIAELFDQLEYDTGYRRYGRPIGIRRPTGTSKILHAAVNPYLFVMWDDCIRDWYGCSVVGGPSGKEYADYFLPRMQELAECAVSQVMEREERSRDDAIESLTPPGHTLSKVLDEYNYVKFTLEDKEVRRLESMAVQTP